MLYTSQIRMKRLILSDASMSRTPAMTDGWLADDADGEPVEAREAHDRVGREGRVDLEEAVPVEHAVDDLADVVGLRLVARG